MPLEVVKLLKLLSVLLRFLSVELCAQSYIRLLCIEALQTYYFAFAGKHNTQKFRL
jgi:hypothetical protein